MAPYISSWLLPCRFPISNNFLSLLLHVGPFAPVAPAANSCPSPARYAQLRHTLPALDTPTTAPQPSRYYYLSRPSNRSLR